MNKNTAGTIDHIIYVSANLERGMDEIEQQLGVRPVIGGRHPDFGTHNALLSLGPATYLEIMCADPDLPAPARGRLVDLESDEPSRLFTWVLRTSDLNWTRTALQSKGIQLGSIQAGRRENTDGALLEWQLTDPYALPLSGAIPFLINWGDSTHPAETAPSGGQLLDLRITHPSATELTHYIGMLGCEIEVLHGSQFELQARIQTAHGVRTLR